VIACVLASWALASDIRLDRVDLLSDDPGRWWWDDLPRAAAAPEVTAARFVAQVQPVFDLGGGWTLGASLSSQSLRRELPLDDGLSAVLGVSTQLGLPRGAFGGFALRTGPVRCALTVHVLSTATWSDPRWQTWTVQPTAALGWIHPRKAPWM